MKISSAVLIVCCLAATSCHKSQERSSNTSLAGLALKGLDPLALMLSPHGGEGRLDNQIRQLQDQIRSDHNAAAKVEQLGWLYVAKARESFDPGYYKLAEQCAVCLQNLHDPGTAHGDLEQPNRAIATPSPPVEESAGERRYSPEAAFLRGHVLHNLHRFKEAEELATLLVSRRGAPIDFGLLGDALMEQGKLNGAVAVYQEMADLKPDLHAFVRAAHVRWLKGDLPGALELAEAASRSVSPRDTDTAAWVLTRLAIYRFQSGATEAAREACDQAFAFRPEYPPALLLRGRMLLAEGDTGGATPLLRRAAELVPLPEYQWTFAEALETNGQQAEAVHVEDELRRAGAAADPRTLAVFLATRGKDLQLALRLAQEELENRHDVLTYDALAWAQASAGHLDLARASLTRALSEGTQDARLFFHAAVLTSRANDPEETKWLTKASALKALLLPSEREALLRLCNTQFPNQSLGLAGAEK
jgi:tetratricopeptide (TPR) repeat protein